MLLGSLVVIGGCTWVEPPSNLKDPVPAYLVTDCFIHSAAVFPHTDGRFVEYSIGDWKYVLGNGNIFTDGLRVLIYSDQLAVGRRFFSHESQVGEQDWFTPLGPKMKVIKIWVEREAAEKTRLAWEARYNAGKGIPIVEPTSGITYRRDPGQYTVFQDNCNHLTVQTLRSLGCRTWGPTLLAWYHILPQDTPASVRQSAEGPVVHAAKPVGVAEDEAVKSADGQQAAAEAQPGAAQR